MTRECDLSQVNFIDDGFEGAANRAAHGKRTDSKQRVMQCVRESQ